MTYIFEYDLEKDTVSNNAGICYAVRYYPTDEGVNVEVGDGYRHEIFISAEYWNRILTIIINDEVDVTAIEAIVKGLMRVGLPEEYTSRFIAAVKEGKIPLIPLSKSQHS